MLDGCNKQEALHVFRPYFSVGEELSPHVPLSGVIKGTLMADSTYTVSGDVYIEDTLVVQPGVQVNFPGNAVYSFIVKGTFLSLGSREKPIYFTVPSTVKTDTYGAVPSLDPAYKGLWGGILGETTFNKIIIKWTHLEFGGGLLTTSPVSFLGNGVNASPVASANPAGILVLEDSWIYGSTNEALHAFGGHVNVMRNTFEKCGLTGGDAIRIASGSAGSVAYNLVVGAAANAVSASGEGNKNPQASVLIYNNTVIECGYRTTEPGAGGSINFEEGSRGGYYNTLMVNCKYGPRVVGVTARYNGRTLVKADTANLDYSNNYNYVDDLTVANEIYPTGFSTHPKTTDIPSPKVFLPTGYKAGDGYDGTSVLGVNNPTFAGFTLPRTTAHLGDVCFVGGADFHLTASSPANGKGTTVIRPLTAPGGFANTVVPVDAFFGSSEITAPGKDIGAFQRDGTGNKH
jgi:hypothetical protein